MQINESILHGEVGIFRVCDLPNGVSKVKTEGSFHVVAPSETTGNHHVIDLKDGVDFYEKDGKLFMSSSVETEVRCVVADRHDAVTIEPGIYEIDMQQEYDVFAQRARNVRD